MKIQNIFQKSLILFISIFLSYCDNSPLATGSENADLEVTFFQIQNITATTAVVTWTCSSESDGILSYGLTGIETTLASPYKSSTHSMTMQNLSPGTQHAYIAFCKDILIATTLPQNFNTLASGPEIGIKQGTANIASSTGAYDFGTVAVDSSSDISFTIENTGISTLNLSGNPMVQVSGTNSSMFSVTQPGVTSVIAGGSITFSIRYTPTSSGAKTATIIIPNNDSDEAPYRFSLTGNSSGVSNTIKQRGIWILGGLTTGNALVSQVDLFDPVTSTWYAAVTSIPTPRSFAGITSIGGKIYVMGGLVTGTIISNLVEEYNPTTNTWRTMSLLPVATHGFVSAAVGDSIYVLNGATTTNTVATLTANTVVYKFSPNNPVGGLGTWATLAVVGSIATAADRDGCSLDGLIYHADGRSNAGASLLLHDAYSTAGNTMTTLAESNAAALGTRHGLAAICYRPNISDYIYGLNATRAVMYLGGSTITAAAPTSQPASTVTSAPQFSHFNPATNTVTNTGGANNLPVAVYFPAAEISYENGNLYVFGGASGTASAPIPITTIQVLALNSPTTNSWTTASTTMPVARYGHKAVILSR